MNKYKKPLKAVLVIAIIGFTAWIILPFFVDKEIDEAAPVNTQPITRIESTINDTEQPETNSPQAVETNNNASLPDESIVRTGEFEGRNNYSAEGTTTLIQDDNGVRYVRFQENFNASNGPDLRVFIGTETDRGLDLGALKGNIGAQNYEIPADLDLSTVDTITIFCRSFNADFGVARL